MAGRYRDKSGRFRPPDDEERGIDPETKKFLELARERFKLAQDAEKKQRDRELEDLKFYAGDQWPDDIRTSRAGQNATAGMPPVPARPCITINKTREPVRSVLNQERQSDLGIELVAADDFGDLSEPVSPEEVELREGLIRRIQRESHAADARTWAFARATIAGRGYYGIMTRYVEGPSWDQEIYYRRFYNQAAVTIDPAHEQPDGSDAEWAFVGADVPWDQYKAEFPWIVDAEGQRKPNTICEADDETFRALGEDYPEWFKTDGEKTRTCRVVEYFYTERVSRDLAQLADGSAAWVDELPDDAAIVAERTVVEKQIKWAKIDATQILDQTDWPGPDLPIVKVVGEELQPYDAERRCEGMVRPAIESNRGFNYMVSKLVELIGLTPIPPLVLDPESIEGFEDWYKAATTRTLPYLPARTRDDQGREFREPHRPEVSSPVQPVAVAVQMFDEAVKSTTGVPDVNLGIQDPSVTSGKMANLLIRQAMHGTSNYMDNLVRSLQYDGRIVNGLLWPIYGSKAGRLTKIVTGTGELETVRINAAQTPTAPGMAKPAPAKPVKTYQLTKDAKFNVAVKVTKAFDLRRDQEATTMGELLTAKPELFSVFGDLFFKNQDGPGHEEMAERAKLMLDPKIQQMLQSKEDGKPPIPPEVQQQMAQGMEMVKALTQTVEKLQRDIDTDAVKNAAQLQKAKLDHQNAIELQRMKDATEIRKAEIAAAVKGVTIDHEHEADALAQAHETALGAADAAHEERMAQMGHDQALEAAEHGVAGQAVLAEQGAAHAAEQAERQPEA